MRLKGRFERWQAKSQARGWLIPTFAGLFVLFVSSGHPHVFPLHNGFPIEAPLLAAFVAYIMRSNGRLRSQSRKMGELTAQLQGEIREHAKIASSLNQEKEYADLLQRIMVAATESSSLEQAVQICVDEVCRFIGWPLAHVYQLAHSSTNRLISMGVWHLEDVARFEEFRAQTQACQFRPGTGLPGAVLVSRQPTWLGDFQQEDRDPRHKAAQRAGIRSALAFPVIVDKKVVAVLEFFSDHDDVPGEKFKEFMLHVAAQLARVIERKASELNLIEARELALAASRAKSQFLANMSHEIRTPLNAVNGMTYILFDSGVTETQKVYVQTIQDSAQALLRIINDVLDFSKIEADKTELETEDFEFPALVKNAVDLMSYSAHQKNLKLNLTVDSQVPRYLKGDSGRIRQILLNLLGNSIKFTDKGSIDVIVQFQGEAAGRSKLFVRVKDCGIGIPEKARDKIFETFSQADNSTTRRYGGTGLGLAICKRLVEMMDGEIGFESVEGAGTEFRFYIQLAKGSAPEVLASLPAPKIVGDLREIKILLAEDNLVNQMLTCKLLGRMGFSVHAVNDGKQAVEAVASGIFDLVLMDCQMPEMDGFAATTAIRQQEAQRGGRIPIIALTANAMKGDRERCLQMGMDEYISKPVDPENLSQTIGKFISAEKRQSLSVAGSLNDLENRIREATEGRAFDPTYLARLHELESEGEPGFVNNLIELFLHNAPEMVAKIKTALETKDFEAIRKTAHSLKSSSADFGAHLMSELCSQLELQNPSERECLAIIDRLESEFHRVRQALETELVINRETKVG